MASASINDIKSRIKSVEGTMQITKAMELVATSKLRAAKLRAERAKPYLSSLADAIGTVSSLIEDRGTPVGKTLTVVIAGDRGLAGGYNSNVFKLLAQNSGEDTVYLPIGKKALEYLKRKELPIYSESLAVAADVGVGSALKIAESIYNGIESGEFSGVNIIYTKFVSMLTQLAVYDGIYPIESKGNRQASDPIIEGDRENVLKKIVPQYIGGYIYGAVAEAVASECASRRTAMNSANKNAEEMIGTLVLEFNRARQAVITQEITEIVSGAEAL